ncbi:MAG: hypothetical protein WA188_16760 [Terriglobales bacterium]
MSISKKSLVAKQPPAAAQPPSTAAIPATRYSPLTAATKRYVGPGQTWFNLTRQDLERMSREQLQKKADINYQQPAGTARKSLWQRLGNLFSRGVTRANQRG